ncbi:MAG: vitamin K epoxide reductase family protein [bacterium]|nr:vitamin K epoxide reductase family protein [bacterium]
MKYYLKIIAIIFLIVSAIGFFDATYLTVEHYRGSVPPCSIAGCEVVLVSQYSVVAGVPVALLGAFYYLMILVLSIAYLDNKKEIIIYLAAYSTFAGFIASIYFVYLQIFVIGHICQYCMVSATTSTILFIFGMYVIFKKENRSKVDIIVDKNC